MSGMSYMNLEANRAEYRFKVGEKDGLTADQQIAMATIHNQQVNGGSCLAIACLLNKGTLRVLIQKQLIDEECRLTKKGDELLKSWWLAARKAGK